MITNRDNLTYYYNIINNIVFGKGHGILVIGFGNSLVSNHYLTKKQVLNEPKLNKSLVSVRKCTIDNNIFVEFDHFR